MQVKGSSIKSTRDFVKAKFPSRYNEWLQSLPGDSQKLFNTSVSASDWYDLKIAYTDPLDKIVKLFYNNNEEKAGEEMGIYSAEVGLKGVYKVFLLVATPQYLMKRATRTMQTFYNPSEIEVSESDNITTVSIKKFEGLTKAIEYRIAGWIAKALDLCKCNNIKYELTSQISAGQQTTDIDFTWD